MNSCNYEITLDTKNCEHMLDARGLLCPEPVMLLHKKIRIASGGDRIKMLATDPSTKRDVARFCEFLRHELLVSDTFEDIYVFIIKKRLA